MRIRVAKNLPGSVSMSCNYKFLSLQSHFVSLILRVVDYGIFRLFFV